MKYKPFVVYALSMGLGFLSFFIASQSLSKDQSTILGITAVVTVLWISEVLPLFVSALIASLLLLLFTNTTQKQVFAPYFDPVIVLFLGSFLIARALQKYRIDEFLAESLAKKFSHPDYFVLGMMGATGFLSMWMSNTASAAVMIPVCLSLLARQNVIDRHPEFARFAVLGVAYSATLGGVATLVGSPPNAIAYRYLRDTEYSINFLSWFLRSAPFTLVALLGTWYVLKKVTRPKLTTIEVNSSESKLNSKQFGVIVIFLLSVLGWLTTHWTGLSSLSVALLATLALFIFKFLEAEDIRKISWETLILFGGGLSLGEALTGAQIGELFVQQTLFTWSSFHPYLLIFCLVFFSVLATMIISNTAAAAILIPLVIPLAQKLNLPVDLVVMLVGMSVSLDFMMPVGTPPNAIAYSTGRVSVKEMISSGVLINLFTAFLLSIFFILYIAII